MEACYLLLDTLTGTVSVNPPSSTNSDSIKSPNEIFNESDNSRLTMLHPAFHSVTFEMPNFQEHSFSHCPQYGPSSVTSSQHHSPHSALLSHQYTQGTSTNTCCENIHHPTNQSPSPLCDWRLRDAERLANWSKVDNINNENDNKNKLKKRSITSNIKAFTEYISDNTSVNTDERNPHPSHDNNIKSKLNFQDKWASAFRHIQNKK